MIAVRSLSATAVAAVSALLLAACGSSSSSQPAGAATTSAAAVPSTTTSASTSASAGMASSSPAMGASAMASPGMVMGGSSSGSPSMAASAHNAADITFATDMISHHRQAVTMADIAATSATSAAVKTLATQIKAAQSPEIAEMTAWLTSWGAKVPAAGMEMGMSGMAMPGLMTGKQMSQLQAAKGAAFDKLWLSMMVSHHQGAVAMAKTELSAGQSSDAKKLAGAIVTSQTAQITTMTTLLAG